MKAISNQNGEAVGSTIHVFERAGLGKAPFSCIGMEEKTYQACHGAPIQPGGSCDYCGQGIRYCFHIKSSDGKRFVVGSDCVAKTEDAGLRKVVDAKVRELKREATHARQDALIAQGEELIQREDVRQALDAMPHPDDRRRATGETKLNQILWYLENAGRSGKSWAAREIIKAAGVAP